MLGPFRGFSVEETHGHTGLSPTKGHKDVLGIGASFVQGKSKRTETVLPGKDKAHGDLISVYELPGGGG